MKRRSLALLALLLFALPAYAAGEPVPATPTDLACAHEHVKTTIYFFDSPVYMAVSEDDHRVSGPATVETVCLDCEELLSVETVADAEEIRPHAMKKDVCALCGYRRKTNRTEVPQSADFEGERTLYARENENLKGLLEMTLSGKDLAELKNAGIVTVLIRGKTGSAAIALRVDDMLAQVEETGADLYMELEEQTDGSFFAALYLVSGAEVRAAPAEDGITLRFYRQEKTGLRASLVPADEEGPVETESVWDDRGYWAVQYLEEGTYFVLQ